MRMGRLLFLLFLSVLVTLHAIDFSGTGIAEAQEGEPGRPVPQDTVRVKADSLTFDQQTMSGTAVGNVRILYEGAILEAGEVFLDLDDKTSYARQRVRLLQGRDILYCEELQYHWETQTGSLQQGELLFEETGYYIRADLLEKTGQDTYSVEGGSFTTCRCPDPDDRVPWEMRAQEGEITLGGYAKVKKATFRILGVPVLYIPSGYLPVKLDRESGFLVPGIGSSGTNGWEFMLPYYWAINASYDATFVLEGLTKRGAKPGIEFRYRPSKDTAGKWNLSMLYDMKVDELRYGLRAEHIQKLSPSFYDKLELKVVSDNDYTEDFPWEVASPSDRILESRGRAVRLTRDGDQGRALTDRTALANRLEATVFISLHANASTVASVAGAETYYMSLDGASDEAAAATAALENRAGSSADGRSPLDLILWDLAQAEVLNESSRLALAVQGRLNARLGLRDRGVKQAPFVVLTGATMPAILVEVGFLSNPSEADRLTQPESQQQLAEAVAAGIEDFLGR